MVTVAAHEALTDSHGEHERPEDWGWHHEFTAGRQIAGWFTVVVLVLLLTSTHYNKAGQLATVLTIAAVMGGLIFDLKTRRTKWRT